jgi:hypothetical protein
VIPSITLAPSAVLGSDRSPPEAVIRLLDLREHPPRFRHVVEEILEKLACVEIIDPFLPQPNLLARVDVGSDATPLLDQIVEAAVDDVRARVTTS